MNIMYNIITLEIKSLNIQLKNLSYFNIIKRNQIKKKIKYLKNLL